MVIRQLQVKRMTGKSVGERPTFYHRAMQMLVTNNKQDQNLQKDRS